MADGHKPYSLRLREEEVRNSVSRPHAKPRHNRHSPSRGVSPSSARERDTHAGPGGLRVFRFGTVARALRWNPCQRKSSRSRVEIVYVQCPSPFAQGERSISVCYSEQQLRGVGIRDVRSDTTVPYEGPSRNLGTPPMSDGRMQLVLVLEVPGHVPHVGRPQFRHFGDRGVVAVHLLWRVSESQWRPIRTVPKGGREESRKQNDDVREREREMERKRAPGQFGLFSTLCF
mgnify:CR=1 FL=1